MLRRRVMLLRGLLHRQQEVIVVAIVWLPQPRGSMRAAERTSHRYRPRCFHALLVAFAVALNG
jgi:hypothetical protein